MALPPAWTVAEAIEEAFERIGFAPSGLTGEHLLSARRSIRLLLDDWNNDDVDFWKVASGQTHAQTLNEASFTPVTGTIDVLRMAVRRNSNTTEMVMISASDWFAIPDKGVAPGMANRCWVQRENGAVTCNIYPKAENSTDVLVYDALVQFNDSSILQGAADVPALWNEAFTAGLCVKLAEKFRPDRLVEKQTLAGGPGMPTGAYARARMGNRERADTVFVVHKGRRQRR